MPTVIGIAGAFMPPPTYRWQAGTSAMLGPRDESRIDLGLGAPRLIPIAGPRSPAQLKHVLPQIDLAGGHEARLRMLGLDTTILRIVALLLAPRVDPAAAAKADLTHTRGCIRAQAAPYASGGQTTESTT